MKAVVSILGTRLIRLIEVRCFLSPQMPPACPLVQHPVARGSRYRGADRRALGR
jgi:hypothetical protein